MTRLSNALLQAALELHEQNRHRLEDIDRKNEQRKSLIRLATLQLIVQKVYDDDGVAELKKQVLTHEITVGKLKQEHAANNKRQATRIAQLQKENLKLKDKVKQLEKMSAPRSMLGKDALDADFGAGVTKPAKLPTFAVNDNGSDSFLSDSDLDDLLTPRKLGSRRPLTSSDVSTLSVKLRRAEKSHSEEEFTSANSTLNVTKAKKVQKIKLKPVDAITRKRQLDDDEVHNYEDEHFDVLDPNITLPNTLVPTILTPVAKRVRRKFDVGSIKSTINE